MTEGKIKQARIDAEATIEPMVRVFHDSLFEVYMKGFMDGLKSSEPIKEEASRILSEEQETLVKLKKDAILQKKLKQEEFYVRVWNVLKAMDIYTLGDIVKHNAIDFLKQRNFGKVCFNEVNDYVAKYGYKIEFH